MGLIRSLYAQTFPPKPTWSVDKIPDLTGRVIIVTGGNTGIGKETVKELLRKNASVYIAARSQERAAEAIRELAVATGKEAKFLQLDLANLKSVKAAAQEFMSKEKELHVLFNNAGLMVPPVEQLTSDGHDLQFGTNVLGHFYLTKLLLPLLLATAKTSPDGHSRVVNTSSSAAYATNKLDFAAFRDSPVRVKKGTRPLYFQSKFGNAVFSNELARRYGKDGVVSTALNPGNINTELIRHQGSLMNWFWKTILLYPVHLGALTQLWAGTTPETLNAGGKFLVPWAREAPGPPGANDAELGKDLWAWMEEQVADI